MRMRPDEIVIVVPGFLLPSSTKLSWVSAAAAAAQSSGRQFGAADHDDGEPGGRERGEDGCDAKQPRQQQAETAEDLGDGDEMHESGG